MIICICSYKIKTLTYNTGKTIFLFNYYVAHIKSLFLPENEAANPVFVFLLWQRHDMTTTSWQQSLMNKGLNVEEVNITEKNCL